MLRECLQLQAFTIVISVTNHLKLLGFFSLFSLLLGTSAIQRGPLWWSSHHRYHHKYSDQKKDIHSPIQSGFWRSHMFWFMGKSNFSTKKGLIGDLIKYPELRLLDRFDYDLNGLFKLPTIKQ